MGFKLMLLIFGLLLTAACSHTDESRLNMAELVNTEWALEEIDGSRITDRVQSTLNFERDDRVVGWGGCNRYFAGLRSDGDGIRIGPIGATRRICPPVVMNQENRFFKALEKARYIRLQDSYLIIESEGNEKPLKFIMIKR